MIYVKNTTEAAETVERARTNLTVAIGTGNDAMDLARQILSLAEAEGVHEIFQGVDAMRKRGLSNADVRERLVDALTRGADDSWSGRTNDARRARFDGIREAISWHLQRLEN